MSKSKTEKTENKARKKKPEGEPADSVKKKAAPKEKPAKAEKAPGKAATGAKVAAEEKKGTASKPKKETAAKPPVQKTEKIEKAAASAPKPKTRPSTTRVAAGKDSAAPVSPGAGKTESAAAKTAGTPPYSSSGLSVKSASSRMWPQIAPGVKIQGTSAAGANRQDAAEKSGDRKLSRKDLADIRSNLLERREKLLAGMKRELAVQRERSGSKAADEVDKATDAYDEDLSFEIATASDHDLGEIQVALEKIDKGTYGECETCGRSISLSRLKFLPFATTCVACRGQEEMAKRRNDNGMLFGLVGGDDMEGESPES